MKILVIEDEYEMIRVIESSLLSENYIVEKATDYTSGREKVLLYQYDCILLDISLPDGNGLKILEEIKGRGRQSGIIIISAHNSLDDKVTGLDLGADDYLTKPFHLAELHARIKAVFRRKQLDGKNVLSISNLLIDFDQRQALVNDVPLKLNRKEFDILSFLAVNTDRLITKEVLAEHVWGDDIDSADNFDFIYAQIKNIRKKLKENQADIVLESVYGIGYRIIRNE